MNKSLSLKGLTVLITRPRHQAAKLEELIRQHGGKPLLFPTIEIEPPPDPVGLQNLIEQIDIYDIAIFLSANAIPTLKLSSQRSPVIIAIGTGTATALQQMGIQTKFIPNEFTSEGLLSLPIFQKIKDSKIVIFCGENPRPLLKETLKERGASVTEAICYRRRKPTVNIKEVLNQFKGSVDIIVSTSYESLLNLYDIFGKEAAVPADLEWLKSTPLLVISAKMVKLANDYNLTKSVILASNPTDQAIIECLLQYSGQRHE